MIKWTVRVSSQAEREKVILICDAFGIHVPPSIRSGVYTDDTYWPWASNRNLAGNLDFYSIQGVVSEIIDLDNLYQTILESEDELGNQV